MIEVRPDVVNLWIDNVEKGPKIFEKFEVKNSNEIYACIQFEKSDGDEFEYLGYDEFEGQATNYIPE